MHHRFKWTKASHRRNWISKEYEPLQPYYLLELGRTACAKTFVDVGANVGLYAVMMSQAVPGIIAYEANPALAREIERNFALNGIEGTVRRAAASNETGTITFGIVSRYAGNSAVVAGAEETTQFTSTDTVRAVRLDDDLKATEGPIAFKIDVEGHEGPVLEGAKETLRTQPCIVQIENFEGLADGFFVSLGYRRLTRIGPDTYFTNIDTLDPFAIYEAAAAEMIAANHESKSMQIGSGDLAVVISGRVYALARDFARKTMGRKL